MARVLIDRGIDGMAALAAGLARRGHHLTGIESRADAASDGDLLLLSWRPGEQGAAMRLDAVRELGWGGPVLLMVAGGHAGDIADAIDAGAADAVPVDADGREIAARAAAVLRAPPPMVIGLGTLRIDQINRAATRDGRPLDLLPREYALLLHLARHAGQCIERTALLAQVWGLRFDPGTNVVAVHISRLRAKLDRGFDPPMLVTEKGRGYRLVAPVPIAPA